MSDKEKDDTERLSEKLLSSAVPQIDTKCPHCQAEISIKRKALFKENTLTQRITITHGHYLQASTLGKTISGMGALLKSAARHMDLKIDVLVTRLQYKGDSIEIDFCSVEAGKQPTAPTGKTTG